MATKMQATVSLRTLSVHITTPYLLYYLLNDPVMTTATILHQIYLRYLSLMALLGLCAHLRYTRPLRLHLYVHGSRSTRNISRDEHAQTKATSLYAVRGANASTRCSSQTPIFTGLSISKEISARTLKDVWKLDEYGKMLNRRTGSYSLRALGLLARRTCMFVLFLAQYLREGEF